jgi:hypothetical protein
MNGKPGILRFFAIALGVALIGCAGNSRRFIGTSRKPT